MDDWNDDRIVLVSAIEHYSYCPRQCALIHVEKVYDENVFTLRGSIAHARVDLPEGMDEHGVRVEKALPIWSEQYGLYGKADAVEFRQDSTVYPVEYKHGPKRANQHDDVQLCAQALCLEEMLDLQIRFGAVYHSSSHQRREVEFIDELRETTLDIIESIRELQLSHKMPEPVDDNRCPNCSLVHACMPSGVAYLSTLDCVDTIFVQSDGEVVE